MSEIGTVHFVFSLLAMAFGAIVLLLPKATRWHRTLGHGYVWCMVGVVATAFAMYDLTGRFTPFHFAAIVAGGVVGGGMWTVLRRRPRKRWIEAHATWMAWSYVGLMGAFVAESLTRFAMPRLAGTMQGAPPWHLFWIVVAVGSAGAIGLGALVIRKRLPGAIRSAPHAMRRERDALRGEQ